MSTFSDNASSCSDTTSTCSNTSSTSLEASSNPQASRSLELTSVWSVVVNTLFVRYRPRLLMTAWFLLHTPTPVFVAVGMSATLAWTWNNVMDGFVSCDAGDLVTIDFWAQFMVIEPRGFDSI